MIIAMAVDLDISRTRPYLCSKSRRTFYSSEHGRSGSNLPAQIPYGIEGMRTFLGCYYLSSWYSEFSISGFHFILLIITQACQLHLESQSTSNIQIMLKSALKQLAGLMRHHPTISYPTLYVYSDSLKRSVLNLSTTASSSQLC